MDCRSNMDTPCINRLPWKRTLPIVLLVLMTFVEARGPPRITSNAKKQQIIKEGHQLKLTCPVDADPQPIMEWTKDDELVTNAWIRYRMTSKSLKVKESHSDDAGLYRCTATNGFGSVSFDFRVWIMPDNNDTSWTPPPLDYDYDIEGLGEPPMFIKPEQMRPANLMRPAGGSIRLRCKASGKPKPAIVWLKDNLPISPETPAELEADWGDEENEDDTIAESRWTLRLRSLETEDSGHYTCKVFNLAGAINYTYSLDVIDRLSPPIVSDPSPVNSTVEYGATAIFQCQVHSDVEPTIQWLKRVEQGSGLHLKNATITVKGQQFIVLKTGKVWSKKDGSFLNKLSIPQVTQQHAGMYVCLGANSMGFNFKSAHLTVLPAPIDRPTPESIFSLPIIIAIPAAVLVVLVIVTIVIVVRRQKQQAQKSLIRTRVPPPPMSPLNDKHDPQHYSALQAYHVQRAPSHERIIKPYSDIHSHSHSDSSHNNTPPLMPYPYQQHQQHQQHQQQYAPHSHNMMNGHSQYHHSKGVAVSPPQVPQMPSVHNMPPIQPPPPIQTFPYHSHTNHLHYAPC